METTNNRTIKVWIADNTYGQSEAEIEVPYLDLYDGTRTIELSDWYADNRLYRAITRLTTEWAEGTCYFDDDDEDVAQFVGKWACSLTTDGHWPTWHDMFKSLTVQDLVDERTIDIAEAPLLHSDGEPIVDLGGNKWTLTISLRTD